MEKENKYKKNLKSRPYHFWGGNVYKLLGGLFFIYKYIVSKNSVLKEVQKG